MSPRKYGIPWAILATALTATPAFATISFWNAPNGEWTNPANWTSPSPPSAPDDAAIFLSPNPLSITLSAPVSLGTLQIDKTALTLSPLSTGSLTFSSTTGQATLA